MTGRIILLKYCLITMAIILIVPAIIGLIFQLFIDDRTSLVTFYSNLWEDVLENKAFVITQTVTLILFIPILGGFAEHLIVQYKRPVFLVGGLTIILLWMALFLSSIVTAAIENTGPFGQLGFWSAITGWLRYGLPLYLIFGILHGLTMGYLVGSEIKNRNCILKFTTRQPHL